MYSIYIKVNLTPMGQRLLNDNTFSYELQTNNKELADIAVDIQNGSIIRGSWRYMILVDEFASSAMPKDMFDTNSVTIEIVTYRPENGEYVYLDVQLNGSSSMKIPFEINYVDKDIKNGDTFSLRPIAGYSYDGVNNELMHSSFTTTGNFCNVELISRRSFYITNLQETRSNRMHMNVVPMTEPDINNVHSVVSNSNLRTEIYNIIEKLHNDHSIIDSLSSNKLEFLHRNLNKIFESEDNFEF